MLWDIITSMLMRFITFVAILILTNSCAVFRLLNSGTVSIKYRVSEATLNDVKYEEADRLTNVSFSIRNVQHPKKHGRWNMNFKITPSVHYDDTTYETGQTSLNPDSGRIEKMANINIKRGIALGNGKFTFHTPAGAFALSAGFGGTIYKMTDGQGLDTIKTREIRRVDFVWYGFLSDRVFFLAGPRYYKAGYESYVFAFRIGYFWGRKNSS